MDVDDAGEDQQPDGVDHLVGARRETAQLRLDGGDPPAIDRDIRHPGAACGHDRAAAKEQVGHASHPITQISPSPT